MPGGRLDRWRAAGAVIVGGARAPILRGGRAPILRGLALGLTLVLAVPANGFRRLPDAAPGLAPLTQGRWRFTTRAGSILVVFDRWDELGDGRPVLIGHRQRSAEANVVALPLDDGGVLVLVTSPAHCERYVFPALGRRRASGRLTLYEPDCESALVVGSLHVRARRR